MAFARLLMSPQGPPIRLHPPVALSICCVTARPRRAAAVLSTLRHIADEVVVAVDVSGGEQDLSSLAGVADRLFEVDLGHFVERALAWLHAQCSAEWVLRIDDDEVPGVGLLEALPELLRTRDVVQYWVSRRWLFPDPGHWLEEWPWFPDFQGRLVRNDSRLWFPEVGHSGVALDLPARYLDSGLYHLVNLLSDRQQRESKAELYRRDRDLRVTTADEPLSTYYLPERNPYARAAAVDSRDRRAIDEVLAASGEVLSHPVAAPRTQHVSCAEVRAHWAERDFDDEAYRATIRPVDVYRHLVANDHRPFRVCVSNEGTEWWPGGDERRPLIRTAYQWLTTTGDLLEREGHRTALPHPLAPGQSCLVAMNVTAPPCAGRYLLALDLVHEHVRWFQCQSQPVEMLITAPEAESR